MNFALTLTNFVQTEEEFHAMFNHELWKKMRSRYNAEGVFLYQNLNFVLQMMNFVLEMMSFVLEVMEFCIKTGELCKKRSVPECVRQDPPGDARRDQDVWISS